MSSMKRKQYAGAFKLKVVLETYKETKTLAQIASEYEVHPVMISQWKTKFEREGPSVFQKPKDQEKEELKELVDELYKQIGQLKVERDWLKKKAETLR